MITLDLGPEDRRRSSPLVSGTAGAGPFGTAGRFRASPEELAPAARHATALEGWIAHEQRAAPARLGAASARPRTPEGVPGPTRTNP